MRGGPSRRELGAGLAGWAASCLAVSVLGAPALAGSAAKPLWRQLPPAPPLPQPSRSDTLALNGTRIFFAQWGQGPHVLLLHGGSASSGWWGHQIAELARSFTVTAMDTRGHGRSPVTSPGFGYKLFAADAIALLDHLGIGTAAVVGWSDGAITGLQLAMTHPKRVSRLYAFGANSSPDGYIPGGSRSPVFGAFVQRCKAEYRMLSPEPAKWGVLMAGLRAMWNREPNFTGAELAAIRAPTVVSDGEHDEIIERGHTVRLAKAIPGARLVILPGVSHFAMVQDPRQFGGSVLEFLER